jgi:4a-hydroxytetrahydrobiopterin dehydratase
MQLSEEEIRKRISELPGWSLEEGKIVRHFEFPSFLKAMDFVNEIAKIAEDHNHHPVMTINWKKVKISLKSFDVNRITENDFLLANEIERLIKEGL